MSEDCQNAATSQALSSAPPRMKKVVETKEDGRLLIYYSFETAGETGKHEQGETNKGAVR